MKFTEKGHVTVTTSQIKDNYLKIVVHDTGRGIPTDNQKLLFHKFQQAGESLLTRDTTRGTGLGLYISRLMAEAMSGSLQLEESVEGKGSSFSLTLPIATPERMKHFSDTTKKVDIKTGLTIADPETTT
jgi:signal transduction histidine kinase